MLNIIEEVKAQSRLFNEPPAPKPSLKDQFELIEDSVQAIATEVRRLENRLTILRYEIEKVGK